MRIEFWAVSHQVEDARLISGFKAGSLPARPTMEDKLKSLLSTAEGRKKLAASMYRPIRCGGATWIDGVYYVRFGGKLLTREEATLWSTHELELEDIPDRTELYEKSLVVMDKLGRHPNG